MPPSPALPEEYVEIQLRFADTAARTRRVPLADAVLQCTNLVRRFGLGDPRKAAANPEWQRYISTLTDGRPLAERVSWSMAFAATAAAAPSDPPLAKCGPFSSEVRGETLRIHFMPADDDGISPLHPSKRERRANELRTVVLDSLDARPDAGRAVGVSWLYTTDGYRSLFPPAHVATATARTGIFTFQGSSSWGQFLDHRGAVKQNLRTAFIDGLDRYDPDAPWLSFPIPTMVVDSPIDVFRAYFEP